METEHEHFLGFRELKIISFRASFAGRVPTSREEGTSKGAIQLKISPYFAAHDTLPGFHGKRKKQRI